MTGLADTKRLVVKIGSSLLVQDDGEIRRAWLDALCEDLAEQRAQGREVVVVTSGAIAIGRRHLKLTGKLQLDEKQAAAATARSAWPMPGRKRWPSTTSPSRNCC